MNRTITLDEPEEQLADRVKWAEQEQETAVREGVGQDEAYFERYAEELSQWIEALKDSGIAEEKLLDTVQSANNEWQQVENPGQEDMACVARRDAGKYVLDEVFGHGTTHIGQVVRGSTIEEDQVRLVGEEGDTIQITVQDKADALSNADLFLRKVGYSIDDIQQEPQPSEG